MEYFAVIAFFLALSAPTNADGSLGGPIYAPGHASLDYYAYPRYAFEYAVRDPHTGDNKAQWEKRDGDLVIGAYSLVEPDGSLRVVEYRADDKSGFNAVVKRIGPNIHPVATPIYKALIPSLGYKSYLPHSIGPVAGLDKLASAPIYAPAPSITSIIKELAPIAPIGKIIEAPILPPPIYAPAPAIIKEAAPIAPLGKIIQTPILPPPIYAPAPAIIKQAAPISPLGKIIAAPVLPSAPIYNAEIIPKPLYNGPIYKEPYLPIYKPPLPIYKAPQPYSPAIIPPIIKPAPLLPEPIYSPYIGKGLPGLKNLESYNLLDKDILDYKRLLDYKAPLDYKGILEYSAPLIYKGYPGLGYTHK